MKLSLGKVPVDVLQDVVFKNLGVERREVVLGPMSGCDGAVLEVGDKSVIVSMDPITGAVEHIGFEAVNVNANDVATFGVEPAFLFSCIMLPEGADSQLVEVISTQMGRVAKELGIAIVGGHCESTKGLTSPIVVCCVMGLTKKGKYVTAAGARTGDQLILTKSAGIEGTAILATDRETQLSKVLTSEMLQTAKDFYKQISVVKDALTAYQTGGVHAMHDPTEGGILNSIHEMADAANLGLKKKKKKIVVKPETTEICRYFKIDPLQLISSGALLIAADPKLTPKIIKTLKQQNIHASVIGEFNSNPKERILKTKKGHIETLPKPITDQLWSALSQH
ncbi:MAG: AIR synthase family protein [Nitrososphaerota archaeon]|jgi:hydrogenase maturation factor|nr:AIR synthase family protein [Nitrososphaerota archaeon]